MVKAAAFERIMRDRIVPVVVPGDPNQIPDLAVALSQGGLGTIEITLRSPSAIDAIAVAAQHGALVVGAGTVMNIQQAERAIGAGAQFLVSPGFDPVLIDWALSNDVAIIPGIATITEAMRAISFGLEFLKLFPAEQLGGVKTIRAMGTVLPDLKIMPTGGVNLENLPDYLSVSSVGAVGGTWIASAADIAAGDFAAITARTRAAVALSNSI